MFRATSRLLKSVQVTAIPTPARTRTTTLLTGLQVHPAPLPALLKTYSKTLEIVSQMPPSAVYRQSVESITKERIALIEQFRGEGGEKDIEVVEEKIGMGLIEEIVLMAEGEMQLAEKMMEWKA